MLIKNHSTSGLKKDIIVFLYEFPMSKLYADVLDFDSYLYAGYNLILVNTVGLPGQVNHPDVLSEVKHCQKDNRIK